MDPGFTGEGTFMGRNYKHVTAEAEAPLGNAPGKI